MKYAPLPRQEKKHFYGMISKVFFLHPEKGTGYLKQSRDWHGSAGKQFGKNCGDL